MIEESCEDRIPSSAGTEVGNPTSPSVHDSPCQRLFELEVDSFRPTAKVVGVDDGREESACHEVADIGLFDPVVAAPVRGYPHLLQADLVALKGFRGEIEKVDSRAIGIVVAEQLARLVEDMPQAVHHHSVVRAAELELP